MRPVLTIVDDFLSNPDAVRNQVIAEGFQDVPFEGTTYHTVNLTRFPEIEEGLQHLYNRRIKLHVSAFRQGKKGSPIHNLVHSDTTCASLAAVLYLNPFPIEGSGTAFWEHRETGWDQQPTADQLQAKGLAVEEFCRDWHEERKWKMVTLAGAKYNRLVTYPTVKFHSRWPWGGFGNNEHSARLIWAGFFDLL